MTTRPRTLGELRASGWASRSVKDEMRANLVRKLQAGETVFPGLVGYDRTVLPKLEAAVLSRHDFILLGLRGQAKTRILRALPALLDEELPVLEGSEVNDDPFAPISAWGRRQVEERGDDAPVAWLPRAERYREKLATPDVTIADLIGDIDPIKAATKKLSFSDEGVIHYGILPRTNRGIFAINELPDLQARIQVGLLNILEEGDIQIRGFPVRMPMDVVLVFSANPEDYTNRGNIITPLRDRIASQIMTHYPRTLEDGMAITAQEAWRDRDAGVEVVVTPWMAELVEQVAFMARDSEFVDQASGVSARMTISLMENVVSGAERRGVKTGATRVAARVSDLFGALSAICGKVELVYEGEREGVTTVSMHLVGRAVKAVFDDRCPAPYADGAGPAARARPARGKRPQGAPAPGGPDDDATPPAYAPILQAFRAGAAVDVSDAAETGRALSDLRAIPGLEEVARSSLDAGDDETLLAAMELVLEGLHQSSLLSRHELVDGRTYRDPFDDMVRSLED